MLWTCYGRPSELTKVKSTGSELLGHIYTTHGHTIYRINQNTGNGNSTDSTGHKCRHMGQSHHTNENTSHSRLHQGSKPGAKNTIRAHVPLLTRLAYKPKYTCPQSIKYDKLIPQQQDFYNRDTFFESQCELFIRGKKPADGSFTVSKPNAGPSYVGNYETNMAPRKHLLTIGYERSGPKTRHMSYPYQLL
jgi:hypothetical protein